MTRLIAIGDIHGHSKALIKLLELISPREGDKFVFLGDLIDRGPDSKGVCDIAIELAQTHPTEFIMGNHEEMALASAMGKSEVRMWKQFGGIQALQSWGINHDTYGPQDFYKLPPGHLRLLGNMSDYHQHGMHVFVHAGYDSRKLEHTPSYTLRWSKLNKNPPPPLYGPYGEKFTVWCGHTVQPRVLDWGHLVCIDTGCGVLENGYLTAVDVFTRTYWHVDTAGRRV